MMVKYRMSIKKELLSRLSITQLKKLAEKKGISFALNKTQEDYYSNWSEKDLMIDVMNDNHDISVKEIEDHLKSNKKLG
jgi:hypothetical protein